MRRKTMVMKFQGSLNELKAIVAGQDVVGSWEIQPNGVHMMRELNGGNLHWAEGSKSLWFDGKPDPSGKLATKILAVLGATQSRPANEGRLIQASDSRRPLPLKSMLAVMHRRAR